MPCTLAFSMLVALLLHVSSQICQAETRIPLVPLVYRHILQERESDVPMSTAFLLSRTVAPIAAPLVAQ